MELNNELCELLCDELVLAAASIKKGAPLRAYCWLMDALNQAETRFHYSYPRAAVFHEDMRAFSHAVERMGMRDQSGEWFARFEKDFRSYKLETALPPCYLLLFNRVTDGIRLLEQGQAAQARRLLAQAQKDAEALYLEAP